MRRGVAPRIATSPVSQTGLGDMDRPTFSADYDEDNYGPDIVVLDEMRNRSHSVRAEAQVWRQVVKRKVTCLCCPLRH